MACADSQSATGRQREAAETTEYVHPGMQVSSTAILNSTQSMCTVYVKKVLKQTEAQACSSADWPRLADKGRYSLLSVTLSQSTQLRAGATRESFYTFT